jgi:uncharacterized protein YybS (DUF2232 family)
MTYNLTSVSNTTGMIDFIQKIDNNIFCYGAGCGGEGGLLGLMLLIIVFGIMMNNFISNGRDINSSLAATSFICFILAVIFNVIGIINPIAIYVTIIVWGISTAIGSRQG